ncbi:unnamed protein product [Natator depressus]
MPLGYVCVQGPLVPVVGLEEEVPLRPVGGVEEEVQLVTIECRGVTNFPLSLPSRQRWLISWKTGAPGSGSAHHNQSQSALTPPTNRMLVLFQSLQLVHQLKVLIILLYTAMVVVGMVGNCLLVHVMVRVKKMHSVTNFLIRNLALSDVAMCTTCIPLTLAYVFEPCGWIFSSAMC